MGQGTEGGNGLGFIHYSIIHQLLNQWQCRLCWIKPAWLDFQDSCSRLRACGAAHCVCFQGKALRAIPAAHGLAPLDAAEPAALDRPGQRPAVWAGPGGYAGAFCGRLCECVPSSTLAVLTHHVTKDGSRTSRPASLWSFHATPQDRRRKVRRGRSRLSSGD